MSTTKDYAEYIFDVLSEDESVSWRMMMGEYIIYYNGKVVGGLYDNRFLVKTVPSAVKLMPEAVKELPYEGAKEMLLVENTDDREFLTALLREIANDLPEPKKKRKK